MTPDQRTEGIRQATEVSLKMFGRHVRHLKIGLCHICSSHAIRGLL